MPEANSDHNGLLTLFGIDRPELESLVKFVDARIGEKACDNTLKHAEHWAKANDADWLHLLDGLAESGGYCDCGIVTNIDPSSVAA